MKMPDLSGSATQVRPVETVPIQHLTTAETALLMNVPAATLRWWRHQGVGPRAFRLGARKVMYKRADIEAYIDEQYNAAPPAA